MTRTIREDLDGVVSAYEVNRDGRPIGGQLTLQPGQEVPDGVKVGEHALTPESGQGTASLVEFDPSTKNTAEVNAYLAEASPAERQRVLEAERSGESRKGILSGPYGDQDVKAPASPKGVK